MRSLVRRFAMTIAVLAATTLPATAQTAGAWPERPVRMIVPLGAGGPADLVGRYVAQQLGERFKQSFFIENRPGAAGIIGTAEAAKAAPDGYTLLVVASPHVNLEILSTNKPYVLMRDLVPVAPVNYSDLVMVVNPSLPAKTLVEYIALAKTQPGKLTYASSGPGTPYHMAGELFKAMSGTDILHVPHKNSGDARNAVIGGHVQMMFDAVTAMKGHVEAGQVRALGTTGDKRSSVMPELPTVSEAGVPGYEATIWLGIMAPKGTPQAIVDRLNAEIARAIASPAIKEAWAKQGAVPMTMLPAEFGTYMERDIAKWADVIKKADIKLQ